MTAPLGQPAVSGAPPIGVPALRAGHQHTQSAQPSVEDPATGRVDGGELTAGRHHDQPEPGDKVCPEPAGEVCPERGSEWPAPGDGRCGADTRRLGMARLIHPAI
jgi:hypothetical protein